MKSIALLLVVSAMAFGQRAGIGATGFNTNAYARPNTFGSITGFGNVVFPGTGHAPVLNHNPRPFTGQGIGARRFGGGAGSVVYIPYAVGVPAYGYGFGNGYAEPGPTPSMAYPQQPPAPQVVINQNFVSETARPVVREYVSDANGGIHVYGPQPTAAAAAAPADDNPTYLIAFKDHTIYAAVAYWVEDGTLHYVTSQNTHNQVSLDLVDRELSDRLNRERSVDFRLPPRH